MGEYRVEVVKRYAWLVSAESAVTAELVSEDIADRLDRLVEVGDSLLADPRFTESDTAVSVVEVDGVPARERPWWDALPGDYNELTRERDGYREDAIAEQRQREQWGD